MQEILFYRELDFSLKSIDEILSSPNYDKEKALSEQKKLLMLKKERLERMISAIDSATKGVTVMEVFDNSEFENYKQEVKERWESTEAYKEYVKKTINYSEDKLNNLAGEMDNIFAEFAVCMENGNEPETSEVQHLVKMLQNHINENYYQCSNEILAGLGQMYVFDERFKNNIDKHADGTAEFVCKAITFYCM